MCAWRLWQQSFHIFDQRRFKKGRVSIPPIDRSPSRIRTYPTRLNNVFGGSWLFEVGVHQHTRGIARTVLRKKQFPCFEELTAQRGKLKSPGRFGTLSSGCVGRIRAPAATLSSVAARRRRLPAAQPRWARVAAPAGAGLRTGGARGGLTGAGGLGGRATIHIRRSPPCCCSSMGGGC